MLPLPAHSPYLSGSAQSGGKRILAPEVDCSANLMRYRVGDFDRAFRGRDLSLFFEPYQIRAVVAPTAPVGAYGDGFV